MVLGVIPEVLVEVAPEVVLLLEVAPETLLGLAQKALLGVLMQGVGPELALVLVALGVVTR